MQISLLHKLDQVVNQPRHQVEVPLVPKWLVGGLRFHLPAQLMVIDQGLYVQIAVERTDSHLSCYLGSFFRRPFWKIVEFFEHDVPLDRLHVPRRKVQERRQMLPERIRRLPLPAPSILFSGPMLRIEVVVQKLPVELQGRPPEPSLVSPRFRQFL